MTTKEPKYLKFLLAIIAACAPMYALLFTPSLPILINFFDLDFHRSQLSMTAFLIGYVCGQIPISLILHRLGRKLTLRIGIALCIMSCFMCIIAGPMHSFHAFLLARFLMGVGSCVGLNIAFTIIGDSSQASKILPFIMLFLTVMTAAATCIGGLIAENMGWEACFYFLIAFGSIILTLTPYVPEKFQYLSRPRYKEIIKQYLNEYKNTQLVLSGIITGCGISIVYLFASFAPFIGMNMLGLKPDHFGAWAMIPSLGFLMGFLFTERFSSRMSAEFLLSLGRKILQLASLLCLGAFYFGHINPWPLFFPMICINTGLAIVFASTAALALGKTKNRFFGSSLMHFVNLSVCVASLFLISIPSIKNPMLLPVLFLFLVLLVSFFIRALEKSLREKIQKSTEAYTICRK